MHNCKMGLKVCKSSYNATSGLGLGSRELLSPLIDISMRLQRRVGIMDEAWGSWFTDIPST